MLRLSWSEELNRERDDFLPKQILKMKTIILFSLLIVITSALELNKNNSPKSQNMAEALTFDTQQVVSEIIREKRQFGGEKKKS